MGRKGHHGMGWGMWGLEARPLPPDGPPARAGGPSPYRVGLSPCGGPAHGGGGVTGRRLIAGTPAGTPRRPPSICSFRR